MKKSFFKEYYFYKLRNLRGFFIASCILNLLNLPLFMVCMMFTSKNILNTSSDMGLIFDYYGSFTFLYIMFSALPALLLLGFLIPPNCKKHNFRKDCADTIGTLPLTHTQRYFGEVLAELTVYILPLVVSSIFAIIVSCAMGAVSFDSGSEFNIFEMVRTYLLACVGTIAFSEMISQLCAKRSATIVYSFALGLFLPLTVLNFGRIIENSAIGLENLFTATKMCSAIPPFGKIIASYVSIFMGEGEILDFSQDAFSVIIFIVLALLCFTAAYFAGKSRKPEFIGQNEFIHKYTSYAVSSIFAIAMMCIMFANKEDIEENISFSDNIGSSLTVPYIIATVIVAFVIFFIFEFIFKKRSIKIKNSLLCCTGAAAVGVVLCLLAQATHGFGAEDYVPSKNSIKEIEVTSNALVTYQTYSYTDKTAILLLTDEHKKLLEEKENLSDYNSGHIEITYKLKNGMKITRRYNADDQAVLNQYLSAMFSVPQSGSNWLTVLTDDSVKITRAEAGINFSTNEKYEDYEIFIVKPALISEFKTLLYSDIMDNIGRSEFDNFATVTIDAELADGTYETQYYSITADYTKTVAFLANRDNLMSAPQSVYSIDDYFEITLTSGDSYITFNSQSKDGSLISEELFSLFTEEIEGEEYSELFEIQSESGILRIKKADEEKAIKLFFEAVENSRTE